MIKDGTSHTLAIGERTYMLDGWIHGARWTGTPYTGMCEYSSNNITYPINASHQEFGYFINDPNPAATGPNWMMENDLYFGSQHPGCANFCFADGSVHSLSEAIDFTVYQDLATISGGETTNRWSP